MRKILVTGATSFIGVHVVKEHLNNNCKVIAIVRPNSLNLDRLPKSDHLKVVEMEMDCIEEIVDRTDEEIIDVFYHFAWEGARAPHRDDVVLQNYNYECAIMAMNAAIKLRCRVFIGAGSQAEYGHCSGKIDETYPTNPTSEYGKAKLKAYKSIKAIANENSIKFIWARIFSVYGIYDYQGTLIMSTIRKMLINESIPLTQGTQNWDYIYVEDVARALYLLANTPYVDDVYNISCGESRKLKDFVIEMKEICNSSSELQFGVVPNNCEMNLGFEPISDKLKKNLQWSCGVKFEDGIRKILRFIECEM